jgi:hypothetical protein
VGGGARRRVRLLAQSRCGGGRLRDLDDWCLDSGFRDGWRLDDCRDHRPEDGCLGNRFNDWFLNDWFLNDWCLSDGWLDDGWLEGWLGDDDGAFRPVAFR